MPFNKSNDIIDLAQQMGGEGFDTFSANDVEEIINAYHLDDNEALSSITPIN